MCMVYWAQLKSNSPIWLPFMRQIAVLQTVSSCLWTNVSFPLCLPSSPLRCTESLSLWTFNKTSRQTLRICMNYCVRIQQEILVKSSQVDTCQSSFARFIMLPEHTKSSQNKSSYLFSLALCLKSSMAFLNRVTLNSPLSLSSNSKLEDNMSRCFRAAMHLSDKH